MIIVIITICGLLITQSTNKNSQRTCNVTIADAFSPGSSTPLLAMHSYWKMKRIRMMR